MDVVLAAEVVVVDVDDVVDVVVSESVDVVEDLTSIVEDFPRIYFLSTTPPKGRVATMVDFNSCKPKSCNSTR